jgi:hypothetical protein
MIKEFGATRALRGPQSASVRITSARKLSLFVTSRTGQETSRRKCFATKAAVSVKL